MDADAIEETLRPFLWLRRIVVGSVVVLLLLALGRMIVGYVAERRWQAISTQLRDAGIALDLTEFQPTPIPNETNAAWFLIQAEAAIDPKHGGARASIYGSTEFGDGPWYTPLWHEHVDASERANTKVFELVNESRKHTGVDWGVQFNKPPFNILLPHLNGARALSNALTDSAERAFVRGDPALGIDRLRAVMHISALVADKPFLVSSLVHAGIDHLTTNALMPHIASLRIGDAPGEVTRQGVRALIDDFLRQELTADPRQTTISRATRTEATSALTAGRELERSLLMARPVVRADVARNAGRQLALTRAMESRLNAERDRMAAAVSMGQPSWTAMGWRLAGFGGAVAGATPVRVSRPVTHTVLNWIPGRGLLTLDRAALRRDAAAIALAIRMYQVDHADAWPESLEALVPDYLPMIPRNKMSAIDAPYGYRLATNTPLVAGDSLPPPTSVPATSRTSLFPTLLVGDGTVVDLVRLPPRPTTAPSSQGVEE